MQVTEELTTGNAVLALTQTNKHQGMCRSGAAWAALTRRW